MWETKNMNWKTHEKLKNKHIPVVDIRISWGGWPRVGDLMKKSSFFWQIMFSMYYRSTERSFTHAMTSHTLRISYPAWDMSMTRYRAMTKSSKLLRRLYLVYDLLLSPLPWNTYHLTTWSLSSTWNRKKHSAIVQSVFRMEEKCDCVMRSYEVRQELLFP